jgi:dolichol-phosphate mannosyltransferase
LIVFVVPAYNEEKNIGRLLEDLHAHLSSTGIRYKVIVVDDGSRDGTLEVLRLKIHTHPVEIISYKPNRGVGEAFRRGFHKAIDFCEAADLIVTLEADGTSDLAVLPRMLAKIDEGHDVVLASVYAPGGRMEGTAAHRLFLSRAANALVGALFPLKHVHTYSSFYRVYRPAALQRVLNAYGDFYAEPGFACVVELLVRLAVLGARIDEVPTVLQGDRRTGKSKMKIGRTIAGYLRVIRRHAFRRAPRA